ncbi:MAG: PH domain-containing protein [Candidatus Gracilibacteria bacterium]
MPHKNFKGQMDEEVVLSYFHRHWIQIFPVLVLMPLSCVAYILVLLYVSSPTSHTILGISFLSLGLLFLTVLIHHQFLSVFRYYLSTVIATNMRIVILDKSVFFKDSMIAIDLNKIQDIQRRQTGLFQHAFGFGSIRLTLAGGEPFEITLVPQSDFQFKKLNEIKSHLVVP